MSKLFYEPLAPRSRRFEELWKSENAGSGSHLSKGNPDVPPPPQKKQNKSALPSINSLHSSPGHQQTEQRISLQVIRTPPSRNENLIRGAKILIESHSWKHPNNGSRIKTEIIDDSLSRLCLRQTCTSRYQEGWKWSKTRRKKEEKNCTNWSILYVFQSNADNREAINHRTKAVR